MKRRHRSSTSRLLPVPCLTVPVLGPVYVAYGVDKTVDIRPHLVGTALPHVDQIVAPLFWAVADELRDPSGPFHGPIHLRVCAV